MKQKNVLLIIMIFSVIFIISVIFGYAVMKIQAPKSVNTPTQAPEAVEVIAVTEAAPPTPKIQKYTIILDGDTLNMLSGDDVIMKTTIVPSLFPLDDITSLKQGRTYSSYEKALMDWESLCG